MDIIELEQYYSSKTDFNTPVRLSKCEMIQDVTKFVKSHINVLKCNPSNKAYLPYYLRLMKLKTILDEA